MVPGAAVVASPCGGVALAAGVTGPGQDEGALIWREREQTVVGCAGVLHTVDVVNLTVSCCARLESWFVDPVFDVVGHGPTGSIEDRRLVHVVPEPGYSIMNELRIERAPPFSRALAGEVREH